MNTQTLKDRIVLLLINGMSSDAATGFCIQQGVSPDQVGQIVEDARKRITVAADYTRDEQLGKLDVDRPDHPMYRRVGDGSQDVSAHAPRESTDPNSTPVFSNYSSSGSWVCLVPTPATLRRRDPQTDIEETVGADLRGDFASHRKHGLAYQRKPKPCVSAAIRTRRVGAPESVKDVGNLWVMRSTQRGEGIHSIRNPRTMLLNPTGVRKQRIEN